MHRTDGAAVKYEVINGELTDTSELGTLVMRKCGTDRQIAILSESGRGTRSTRGEGRTPREDAFEIWLDNPE